MPTRDTNQSAHVAFSATVASAMARSIRDKPLCPHAHLAPGALGTVEVTDVPGEIALGHGEEAA